MLIVEGHMIVNYSEHMTDDELFEFCQANKGLRIERDAQKNIIIMAPVSGESGINEKNFIYELEDWRRKNGNGESFSSSTGFILPNGAMKSPDASWMSGERWNSIPKSETKKFPKVAPDFIVEVRSPSDNLDKAKAKMSEWIENGVRLAWLIDVKGKQTFVYRDNGSIEIIKGFQNILSGEDVLEGFVFDLQQLIIP